MREEWRINTLWYYRGITTAIALRPIMTITQLDSARLWKTSLPGIELFEARRHRHRFGKHFHLITLFGFTGWLYRLV